MKTSHLAQWASDYHVPVKRDTCGDEIVRGRNGDVYQYDSNRFGVCFMPSTPSPRKWTAVRSRLVNAGFELHQVGNCEGTAVFNPNNKAQSKVALEIIAAKCKRHLSPERRAAFIAAGSQNQFSAGLQGTFSA